MENTYYIDTHQKIFSLIAGLIIFISILELVRRQKLKEEFSWIWLLAGSSIALIVVWEPALNLISQIVGAKLATTTLFLSAIFFLIAVNIQISIKASLMSDQIKNLTQKIAILETKLNGKKNKKKNKS